MKQVKEWLKNSKFIASLSGENFKTKFNNEIDIREKIAQTIPTKRFKISPKKIAGTYRVIGQNPDDINSCYIGNVEILFTEGMWNATWNIVGFTHQAYGIQVSDNILVFNYSYQDADSVYHIGMAAYTFYSNKVVRGQWVEDGYPEKGAEELRKLEEGEEIDDSHDANMGFSLN